MTETKEKRNVEDIFEDIKNTLIEEEKIKDSLIILNRNFEEDKKYLPKIYKNNKETVNKALIKKIDEGRKILRNLQNELAETIKKEGVR